MNAELLFLDEGKEIVRPLGELTILGRGQTAHVRLQDAAASRSHAAIRREGAAWVIEDLNSRNGTYLNNTRIRKKTLNSGDRILIGEQQLTFRLAAASHPESSFNEGAEKSLILAETDTPDATMTNWLHIVPQKQSEPETIAALRHRLMILQDLCEMTARSQDAPSLIRRGVESLMGAYPQANRCSVLLAKDASKNMRIEYEEIRDMVKPGSPSCTIISHVIESRKATLSSNVSLDPRFDSSQSLAVSGTKSVLCSPLLLRGEVGGLVYLESLEDKNHFTPDDLQLLATVTADLAIGIENAVLHEERIGIERLAAMGQAIAGMAHCVKNVLNAINFGSYIIEQGLTKREIATIDKGWELMKRSNSFLHNMVMDMLSYSKPRQPSYEQVDLNEFVGRFCDSSLQMAKGKGVKLEFRPAGAAIEAWLDRVAIERCLHNLVGNAIDACEGIENGCVAVSVAPASDDAFRIAVSDTGCGMTPDVKEKLFEAFFSTKGERGTGLGLSVAAKTVKEHHGTISIESEIGRGSSFIITLPIKPPVAKTETGNL